MKTYTLLTGALLLSACCSLFAQQASPDTSYWKAGGTFTFAFSQVSLTNWAAGGDNSVSGNGIANLFLNYNRNRASLENFMGTAYGLMKQGSESVRKTNDKLEVYSKFGYQARDKWYYTALARFSTQFTDGYKYPNDSVPISKAFSPAYINLAAGMDYKPSDRFTLYIAPVSGKVTIVSDDSLSARGAFGVDPGKTSRSEFGGYLRVRFTDDILQNVNLLTTVDLFSNYLEDPLYIDVSWELALNMTINKWLTATLSTHMIFDEDIKFPETDDTGAVTGEKAKVQFKEVFGLGLTFRL